MYMYLLQGEIVKSIFFLTTTTPIRAPPSTAPTACGHQVDRTCWADR
eukprot:SAG31_NODE_6267_length_2095_cov_4.782064_2_plen_46_part_01